MKFHLIHMSGAQEGRTIMFENPTVIIGRDPGCDFRFPADLYPTMPPQFAQIVTDGRGACVIQYIVTPDSVAYGTISLNGIPMERPSEILPTDTVIQLGVQGPSLYFRIGIPTIGTNSYVLTKPKVLAKIEMLSGADKGRVFELTSAGPFRIGRNINMELPLSPMGDMFVSGRHAIIDLPMDGRWQITDTSRYGTLVNGRLIGTAALHNNDVIGLGKKGPQARFITGEGLAEATAAAPEIQMPVAQERRTLTRETTVPPIPAGPVPQAIPESDRIQPKPAADMDSPIPIPVTVSAQPAKKDESVVAASPFARSGAPGVPPNRSERSMPGVRRKRGRRIKPMQKIALVLTVCFVVLCLGYWGVSALMSTRENDIDKPATKNRVTKPTPQAQATLVPTATLAPVVVKTPAPVLPIVEKTALPQAPAPQVNETAMTGATAETTPGKLFAPEDGISVRLPSAEWEIKPKVNNAYVIKTPSGIRLLLSIVSDTSKEQIFESFEKKCKEADIVCKRSNNGTSIFYKGENYNYVIPIEKNNGKVVNIVVVENKRLSKESMTEVVQFAELLSK